MSPFLATVVIVSTAAILLIWVWSRSAGTPSAAELLERAQGCEDSIGTAERGVVFQRVSIRTSRHLVEHDLYRDLRGVRRRRPQHLGPAEQSARQMLGTLGVDFEAPLSAASYRTWHDSRSGVVDHVSRGDSNHLTLVSRMTEGPIEQESLTIRASDLRPVERVIEAREYGTIEIAELSYAVLDWSAVNDALFEPLTGGAAPSPREAVLPPPAPPAAAELDRAELEARLVLNRLHADEGEQITVTGGRGGVLVRGLVESEQRRREILSGLSGLRYVRAEVGSIEELRSRPGPSSAPQSIRALSLDSGPSSLERYLSSVGGRPAEADGISRRLLDGMLRMRLNAHRLLELRRRFSLPGEQRSDPFLDLSGSYTERLNSGLEDEVQALEDIPGAQGSDRQRPEAVPDLWTEIERNESLSRELISGGDSSRDALSIVSDIYLSIVRIRAAVEARSSHPQPF